MVAGRCSVWWNDTDLHRFLINGQLEGVEWRELEADHWPPIGVGGMAGAWSWSPTSNWRWWNGGSLKLTTDLQLEVVERRELEADHRPPIGVGGMAGAWSWPPTSNWSGWNGGSLKLTTDLQLEVVEWRELEADHRPPIGGGGMAEAWSWPPTSNWRWWNGGSLKLTTDLNLVPMSRMSGAVHPLHHMPSCTQRQLQCLWRELGRGRPGPHVSTLQFHRSVTHSSSA